MVSTQKTGTNSIDGTTGARLQTLTRRFNSKVARAQAAIFVERLWPRAVPPLCVSGLFLTTSWIGLWHALPAQGRMAGVLAFGAAAALSPLFVKAKTLLVTKEDALNRLDDALNDPTRPAHMINDRVHDDSSAEKKEIWAAHRLQLLETWLDKIDVARPRSDVPRRDPYYSRYLIAASVALAAVFAGDLREPRLAEAFNWQAPIIPIKAKAWVNPPENFKNEALVLTQDTPELSPDGQKRTAHKNSTMTIVVFDRKVPVAVNGIAVPLAKEILPKNGTQDKPTYHYELKLDQGEAVVTVGSTLRWKIDVGADNAPSATLDSIGVNKQEPNTLELQYREKDDFGVQESSIAIIPPAQKDPGATPLPSITLPRIELR